jgi:hypothetical protein
MITGNTSIQSWRPAHAIGECGIPPTTAKAASTD